MFRQMVVESVSLLFQAWLPGDENFEKRCSTNSKAICSSDVVLFYRRWRLNFTGNGKKDVSVNELSNVMRFFTVGSLLSQLTERYSSPEKMLL